MEEVLNGVPAYSETVAFKVTKYEIDPLSEDKIPNTETNFYFSNIDEENIVKFFDSQVKYIGWLPLSEQNMHIWILTQNRRCLI